MVRWQITLLTALAFTLVVCLLTVMLAFVNGMYRLTENSGQPGNVIVLSDGATDELFSNLGYGRHQRPGDATRRTSCTTRQAGRWRAGKSTSLSTSRSRTSPVLKSGRRRRFLQLRGIDDPGLSTAVHGLSLHPGGAWFSSACGPRRSGRRRASRSSRPCSARGLPANWGRTSASPAWRWATRSALGPRAGSSAVF